MTELGLYTAKYKAVLIQVVQGMKGEAMRTKNLTTGSVKQDGEQEQGALSMGSVKHDVEQEQRNPSMGSVES